MRICSIVGARPQFVKAAVVSAALREQDIQEVLVHTGQHYDAAMSAVFFRELGIPQPAVNLGVGSGMHGAQTAAMLTGIEQVLHAETYDGVILYGDTNSTLAGALAAAKLHIPVAHVEAGLRSGNRRMPEEINRILTDHASDVLFCPTETAVQHLAHEGVTEGVYYVGDVMRDATLRFKLARPGQPEGLAPSYGIVTIHRAENTDMPERMTALLAGLGQIPRVLYFPVHPRTRRVLAGMTLPDNITLMEPLGYLDMLQLLRHAEVVFTDSGGLQKEAFWLDVPCITLRDETEWVETLQGGWNQVVGASSVGIAAAFSSRPTEAKVDFGRVGGRGASEQIARLLSAEWGHG